MAANNIAPIYMARGYSIGESNEMLFGMSTKGEIYEPEVLKAIFEGKMIDTSSSIDPETGECLIRDV